MIWKVFCLNLILVNKENKSKMHFVLLFFFLKKYMSIFYIVIFLMRKVDFWSFLKSQTSGKKYANQLFHSKFSNDDRGWAKRPLSHHLTKGKVWFSQFFKILSHPGYIGIVFIFFHEYQCTWKWKQNKDI